MDIYLENDKSFYKQIKKYLKNDSIIHLKLDNYDIIDDSLIDNIKDQDLKFKIYSICAINIKDIEKRYSYIYDIVCDYLDNLFLEKNLCDFKENRCISVRNSSHCKESLNGCCYGRKRGLCKSFKDGKCSIKSLSCKLFTCRYLRKNNIKIKVNDIVLLKYFFNNKQKFILDTSIFKDKDEIIDLLIKNK